MTLPYDDFEPGQPLVICAGELTLHPSLVAPHELIFRFLGGPAFSCRFGDYLIAEPRADATTGELVIVERGDNAYLGSFWSKHGSRLLLDDQSATLLADDFLVLAAVTVIARIEPREGR